MKKTLKEARERLYAALLTLRSKEECATLLRDLCTESEIDSLAERFAAAERIAQHEPYRKIAREMDMSLTTVARVAQWFYNGTGGYATVIRRLQK